MGFVADDGLNSGLSSDSNTGHSSGLSSDSIAGISGSLGFDGVFFEERFPYCGLAQSRGMTVLAVPHLRYLEFCASLKATGFNYLSGISAVDWPDRDTIDVVGHVFRVPEHAQVQFVVSLRRLNPVIDSVVSIWPSANWHEREVYDLFGVEFVGHPNLCRIMLPEDFSGHPLLKDFTQRGDDEA